MMRISKRFFLIFCLAIMFFAAAYTEPNANINLLSSESVSGQLRLTSFTSWQNNVLIKTNRGLYAWAPHEVNATLLIKLDHGWLSQMENPDFFDIILSDNKVLYALNSNKGLIWPFRIADGKLINDDKFQLDWQHFIHIEGAETLVFPPKDVLLSEGKLFMLAPNEFDSLNHLVSVDMNDGQLIQHSFEGCDQIQSFTKYTKNSLLIVSAEEVNFVQGQNKTISVLSSYNTTTNEVHRIGVIDHVHPYHPTAVMYDNATDVYYFTGENILYRMSKAGEIIECANLTESDISKMVLLDDGRIAALSTSGLLIRQDNPNQMDSVKILRIAGRIDNDLLRLVLSQQPDLKIEQVDGLDTNEEIVESMLTGSPAVDVYVLESNQHAIESMIQKGHLLPLPKESYADMQAGSSLDIIKNVLAYNGSHYGLPIGLDFTIAQHYESLLYETGLASPVDFTSYCNNLAAWSIGTFDDFPEYRFTGNPREKAEAYRLAFRIYRDHLRKAGDELTFDTTLFRSIMEMISQLDTDGLDDLPNPEDMFDDVLGIREMITNNASYSPSLEHDRASLSSPYSLVMYSLHPGGVPSVKGNLRVLAISARTALSDEAQLFIDACARQIPTQTIALMTDKWTKAVENPLYESEVDRYRYLISDVQGMIDSALRQGAKSVPSYEADLAKLQAVLAEAESTLRYLLTEEEVKMMRERLLHVYIPTEVQRLEDRSGIDDLFTQFIEGALPLEQFIQSADSRLRLVRLENE